MRCEEGSKSSLKERGSMVLKLLFNFSLSLSVTFHAVSKPAPNFEGTAVVNGEFKELKLSDYKGRYLVLVFYPLDL